MRWLALALVAACNDSQVTLQPVIDLPLGERDSASAFPLDQLILEVAHDGDPLDLASAKFGKGQTVSVGGVPFADDLVVHLTGFVGAGEVAYGRSCAVALTSSGATADPHLYFSRSVKFGELATALPTLRATGAAVTYHDGSGLLLSGVDPNDGVANADVERFDPRTGELAHIASLMPRVGAVAVPLGLGDEAQIAVLGGAIPTTSAGAQFVELVEADAPASRRVQMVSDANMARVGLTATALSDGSVIAIGGRQPPASPPAGDVDVVTTDNGTAVVRALRATLANPRYGHTATRLGNDVGAPVLVAGGLDTNGQPIAAAELFKPLAESFSTTFTASMVAPRSQHQAVRMPDNSVLFIGGVDAAGAAVATLELFTPDAGFVNIGMLPSIAGLVDFTATTLPDGRVLVTGGRKTPGGDPVNTAFIVRLDPINGAVDVVATDHLVYPRAGHQATLLCDGTVLVSGGTTEQLPPERYNPPPDGRR